MSEPRSWLFVPADSERKIAKALDSDADAIIFDLEDSVAPAQKAARARNPHRPRQPRRRPGMVGAGQPARAASISRTTSKCSPMATIHGIVLPKAESGADVTELAHRTGNIPIHAIVTETAASLFGLLSYRDPEQPAGGDELGRGGSVGGARRGDAKMTPTARLSFTYRMARSLCLAGAVAAGVQPVDGVFADFRDEDGLARRGRSRRARRLHRQARDPPGAGRGDQRRLLARRRTTSPTPRRSSPRSRPSPTPACLSVGGKMVDRPHLLQAQRVLESGGCNSEGIDQCRRQPRAGAPTPPTSRSGRWTSSAAPCAPTMSPSRSPTPASAIPICTPAATTGAARQYPVIPGHEIVGTVTAIGDEVTRHKRRRHRRGRLHGRQLHGMRPVPRRLGSVLPQGLHPDLQQRRLSRRRRSPRAATPTISSSATISC